MSKRAKFLVAGLAVALVAAALVGWTIAQGSDEQTMSTTVSQTFLGRVAANLGVTEEKLTEAITQARLQLIDEAVEQGRITQEQADRMKQQITGSQALLGMIDEALEQGRITQEQATWMKQQIAGRWALGWRPRGFHGGRWGLGGQAGFGPWGGRVWGGCGR